MGLFPYPVADFSGEPAFPVLAVHDVATVEIHYKGNRTPVRLIGVAELGAIHPQNSVPKDLEEANTFTRNLLLGEPVYLHFDENRIDRSGRLQAYLYRAPDGLFVNLEIVRQGYGKVNTQVPFKHIALFQQYEQRAHAIEKGLWPTKTSMRIQETVSPALPTSGSEIMVYITRTGKKYHRADCSSLRKSRISVSLEEAKQFYTPCLRCRP